MFIEVKQQSKVPPYFIKRLTVNVDSIQYVTALDNPRNNNITKITLVGGTIIRCMEAVSDIENKFSYTEE